MFFCEFFKISKNTFSYRTPPVAASKFNVVLTTEHFRSYFRIFHTELFNYWRSTEIFCMYVELVFNLFGSIFQIFPRTLIWLLQQILNESQFRRGNICFNVSLWYLWKIRKKFVFAHFLSTKTRQQPARFLNVVLNRVLSSLLKFECHGSSPPFLELKGCFYWQKPLQWRAKCKVPTRSIEFHSIRILNNIREKSVECYSFTYCFSESF